MGDNVMTNSKTIVFLGVVTTFGAFMGILADCFSAWSPNTSEMETAFSVSLDNIRGFYDGKPRWTFVLGNYFGVIFIPLHILGFFLSYHALKPASPKWAIVYLAVSVYIIPVGVGLHGTLAFIGDIIQFGNEGLINGIRIYWEPWAFYLVFGYSIASILILTLILTGRSLYPRWVALVSPIGFVVFSGIVNAILPDSANGLKVFLSITGLNLPLMVFFAITTWVLVRHKKEFSLSL
jgi:hypothetical protein